MLKLYHHSNYLNNVKDTSSRSPSLCRLPVNAELNPMPSSTVDMESHAEQSET